MPLEFQLKLNTVKLVKWVTTLMEEGDKTPADIFYAQDPGGLGSVEDVHGTSF